MNTDFQLLFIVTKTPFLLIWDLSLEGEKLKLFMDLAFKFLESVVKTGDFSFHL